MIKINNNKTTNFIIFVLVAALLISVIESPKEFMDSIIKGFIF
ncbi:hypothetical protein SAMN06297358_3578 [Pedobacter xixiisoli]|uniref:Uncharacterized protein n=1 Tax=Pedobacter xixiisoli TaxID=1476464 RepID=A0A286AD86_9SPHI|nr:hypothetical protein SAMN06297358_3578 [Pedobacter xixiisoli]